MALIGWRGAMHGRNNARNRGRNNAPDRPGYSAGPSVRGDARRVLRADLSRLHPLAVRATHAAVDAPAGTHHEGIDPPAKAGEPVRTTTPRVVIRVRRRSPGMLPIVLQHAGFLSALGHQVRSCRRVQGASVWFGLSRNSERRRRHHVTYRMDLFLGMIVNGRHGDPAPDLGPAQPDAGGRSRNPADLALCSVRLPRLTPANCAPPPAFLAPGNHAKRAKASSGAGSGPARRPGHVRTKSQCGDPEPGDQEPMSEIGDKVKKIVVEHLGVEESKVTPEASFIDDLGADSLDTVELVMAFEEAFGVEIPEDAAEKISTVKDAIDYIEKQKAA